MTYQSVNILYLRQEKFRFEKPMKSLWRLPSQRGFNWARRFILLNSPAWLLIAFLRRLHKSDYKSKRESIFFFQFANVAYGMRRRSRTVRLLRVAFGLIGDELPGEYSRLCIRATIETHSDPSCRSALSGKIIDATKALAIETTDATGWYQLSRGLFSLGYFSAAWVARENSLDLSVIEGEGGKVDATAVWRSIQAHLERRNVSEVEVLLISSSGIDDFVCDIRNYLDMMQKKYLMPVIDPNSPNLVAEELFRKFITGKSVALVGTGSHSDHFGVEIDSADVIVRLKYIGREHLPAQEFHGNRCDISVLPRIDSLVKVIESGIVCEFIEDLKMILGAAVPSDSFILSKPVQQLSIVSPIFRSTSTTGIRAIFQILLSEPRSLKIFGFDFYTKREMYDSSIFQTSIANAFILGEVGSENFYTTRGDQAACEISMSFSAHDPVSNFCFAQNLYKAGLFDIEPYGKSILELTPYQYVERLEEMLGDW